MFRENLIGICEEPTTYSNDFRAFRAKKVDKNDNRDIKKLKFEKRNVSTFAESHDTFQKLDYNSRLPFDALWRVKEIVGTKPAHEYSQFYGQCHREIDENPRLSRKPIELVSPAVNLDKINDPEIRKIVTNYLYKSTVARAADEVWRDFHPIDEKCAQNSISKNFVDPINGKMNLNKLEDPIKWDFSQNRRLIDRPTLENEKSSDLGCDEINIKIVEDHQRRRAIMENKLRLPYDKLPLSYGGHRTALALGVPLVKKKFSPYDPDLTVSQALASRRY